MRSSAARLVDIAPNTVSTARADLAAAIAARVDAEAAVMSAARASAELDEARQTASRTYRAADSAVTEAERDLRSLLDIYGNEQTVREMFARWEKPSPFDTLPDLRERAEATRKAYDAADVDRPGPDAVKKIADERLGFAIARVREAATRVQADEVLPGLMAEDDALYRELFRRRTIMSKLVASNSEIALEMSQNRLLPSPSGGDAVVTHHHREMKEQALAPLDAALSALMADASAEGKI